MQDQKYEKGDIVKVNKVFSDINCEQCPYEIMEGICFKGNYDICIARNKKEWIVVIENGRRKFVRKEVDYD